MSRSTMISSGHGSLVPPGLRASAAARDCASLGSAQVPREGGFAAASTQGATPSTPRRCARDSPDGPIGPLSRRPFASYEGSAVFAREGLSMPEKKPPTRLAAASDSRTRFGAGITGAAVGPTRDSQSLRRRGPTPLSGSLPTGPTEPRHLLTRPPAAKSSPTRWIGIVELRGDPAQVQRAAQDNEQSCDLSQRPAHAWLGAAPFRA